jgi:hypothetical protein
MILVGFTGTRDGMTFKQKVSFRDVLAEFRSIAGQEFHHGDCLGADAQAAWVAKALNYNVVCHPPSEARLRAFAPSDLVLDPRPYLSRNRDIVDGCAVLIACPKEFGEQHRSGTWSTIRYARSVGRRIILVQPNGNVVREGLSSPNLGPQNA